MHSVRKKKLMEELNKPFRVDIIQCFDIARRSMKGMSCDRHVMSWTWAHSGTIFKP